MIHGRFSKLFISPKIFRKTQYNTGDGNKKKRKKRKNVLDITKNCFLSDERFYMLK